MKDVVGYEDYFSITDKGDVFSKRTKRFLKLRTCKNGYKTFTTRLNGRNSKSVCLKVHRLVAMAYIPNTNNHPIINHKDGDKLNNCVSNLEWCTHSHNTIHAYENGLMTHNLNLKCFSLTPEEQEFIINNYKPNSREFGARSLGRMFNCDRKAIKNFYDYVKSKDF